MRVKNIAVGFVDASGFHPIRRSPDYDPGYENLAHDSGSAKDGMGLKYRVVSRGGKRVRVYPSGRKAKSGAKRKVKAKKHTRRAFPTNIQPDTLRKHNPIPTQWVSANVKRVGNDIQVMLFPKGKVAKRRAAKRRTTRRRTR